MGFPERGHQTRLGWGSKLFSRFMRRYIETGMRYDQSYTTNDYRKLHYSALSIVTKVDMTLNDFELLRGKNG